MTKFKRCKITLMKTVIKRGGKKKKKKTQKPGQYKIS